MIKRIGFACKWIDRPDQVEGIKPKDDCKKYNTGATTVSWLNRQNKAVAEQRLWDLMVQNIEATRLLVERVGQRETSLRMLRLSSDILPVYTESSWSYFWRRNDVMDYCSRNFQSIGQLARLCDIKLSFHPGQFCVLASESDAIVERSIEEFEYHADMARWMGYGQRFQDLKINVHISGRRGPAGIRAAYPRLSPEARNCITIENEEMSHGLDTCLELADLVPIVLDLHHHWVKTGEYLDPADARVQRVVDSWRGVRPTCHYSVSQEELLQGYDPNQLLDHAQLLAAGHKKQKLRAHSNFYWNTAINDWALSFLDKLDIMCESKGKNLASLRLYNQAQQRGVI